MLVQERGMPFVCVWEVTEQAPEEGEVRRFQTRKAPPSPHSPLLFPSPSPQSTSLKPGQSWFSTPSRSSRTHRWRSSRRFEWKKIGSSESARGCDRADELLSYSSGCRRVSALHRQQYVCIRASRAAQKVDGCQAKEVNLITKGAGASGAIFGLKS